MGFLLYISYHGAFIYSYGILLYGCIPSGLTMTKIKDYDLITVDEHRIQTTIDVYFQWKTLDIMLSTLSTRGINFPSEISENIVCYTCGYFLNKGSSGDAIDPNGNRIIEIKGSSSTGPSSFSPSERFDELVFVKLNKQNDTLLIYVSTHKDSQNLLFYQILRMVVYINKQAIVYVYLLFNELLNKC